MAAAPTSTSASSLAFYVVKSLLCLNVALSGLDILPVTVATTVSFDGTQFLTITMPEVTRTEVEDISIRFRTARPNGLIFATISSQTTDRLELMLEGGKLRYDVNLGSGSKVSLSNPLNVVHYIAGRDHVAYIQYRLCLSHNGVAAADPPSNLWREGRL